MSNRWIASDMPSLTGKTALVTGANGGLGYYVSLELARKGAQVLMACRSAEKGRQAAERIAAEAPGAQVEVIGLDLADLEAVRRCAGEVRGRVERLDILVNNAGVMGIPRTTTAQGFEMQFGANHLGHFALTAQLLDLIEAAPAGRVVQVSSLMHLFGKMNFDDLMGERRYERWAAYSQSKLANLLFAYELQRRLAGRGSRAISLGAHPGYAATNLQYVNAEMTGSRVDYWRNRLMNAVLAQTPAQGALPILFAAAAPQAQGGMFIGPHLGSRGYPKVVRSSPRSYDRAAARRLWEASERLTANLL
jgi:NAD(P)-dependent dehydrogenase (short-subunit alcohol dehydrogenase family)